MGPHRGLGVIHGRHHRLLGYVPWQGDWFKRLCHQLQLHRLQCADILASCVNSYQLHDSCFAPGLNLSRIRRSTARIAIYNHHSHSSARPSRFAADYAHLCSFQWYLGARCSPRRFSINNNDSNESRYIDTACFRNRCKSHETTHNERHQHVLHTFPHPSGGRGHLAACAALFCSSFFPRTIILRIGSFADQFISVAITAKATASNIFWWNFSFQARS